MAIGNYCQICGQKKRWSEVKGEAHGAVVTSACLMKVYGDPPLSRDQVREMVKFCAVCGAQQPLPLPEHCGSCGSPLFEETGKRDLEKLGRPGNRWKRLAAFLLDLVIIFGLFAAASFGIMRLKPAEAGGEKVVSEMVEGEAGAQAAGEEEQAPVEETKVDPWRLAVYVSFFVIFIFYHGLFVAFLGRTPGKALFKLQVLLKNGSPKIGAGRSLLRSALYFFTLYVVPIGFLPLIFQEPPGKWLEIIEKNAMFHNDLTDTVVLEPAG